MRNVVASPALIRPNPSQASGGGLVRLSASPTTAAPPIAIRWVGLSLSTWLHGIKSSRAGPSKAISKQREIRPRNDLKRLDRGKYPPNPANRFVPPKPFVRKTGQRQLQWTEEICPHPDHERGILDAPYDDFELSTELALPHNPHIKERVILVGAAGARDCPFPSRCPTGRHVPVTAAGKRLGRSFRLPADLGQS